MGYWEYDTGYYEPSEFDEKCEELKDYLRDSVTKELKEKLETLQKENEHMKDIADNTMQRSENLRRQKKNSSLMSEISEIRLEARSDENACQNFLKAFRLHYIRLGMLV